MQTYLVGGAVRDALLGLPVEQREAVIMVGAIITHVRLREPFGKSVPAIVLLLLAIFVAWGRFGAYAF